MSTEETKSASVTDEQDTPRNTIRVIKSDDTDDTVVEVKVAGESEAKVTVFGGESPKNEKPEKGADEKKKETDTKGGTDDETGTDDKKDSKEHKPLKPMSQDEIDRIIKQHAKMDEKNLKKYLDFFWSIDPNRLGRFNIQQFANRLFQKGCFLSSRQIAEIFTDIDHNNDMLISLDEYLTEMSKNKRRPRTQDELKELFSFFDRNGDGFVCREDVQETMTALNLCILEPCITEFLESGGSGRQEKLNLQEFSFAVKRLRV